MTRPRRVEFEGALYHVLARGNNKQDIFGDVADRRHYLALVERYHARYVFRLYAFVLMTNHVHLLVETGETPLSKIMQCLQTSYTQYFNRKYQRVGHLFQGRYKSILCERESYLLELTRYIHLNPVRAGIVQRPEQYPWSSYQSFIGRARMPCVDHDLVLKMLGNRGEGAARRYQQFVAEAIDAQMTGTYYKTKEQVYLGSEDYIDSVKKKIHNGVPLGKERRARGITLAQVLEGTASCAGLDRALLTGKGGGQLTTMARALAIYLARVDGRCTVNEIATTLGIHPSTVTRAVARLEERLEEKNKNISLTQLIGCVRRSFCER